jgi:DNA polymerase V
VFAHTSPHQPGPRFSQSTNVALRRPMADTAYLVQAAVLGLRAIYQRGFELIKAGVMLLDLVPGSLYQGELDLEPEATGERARLMATHGCAERKIQQGHGAPGQQRDR